MEPTPTAFESVVTAMQGWFANGGLWTQVTELAPFIGIVAIFAFGYYVTRKVVKGAGKGKVSF